MTSVAKVFLAAAMLCFVVWGITLWVGLQPLVAAPDVQVIYGENEDFFSDAVVYRKARNGSFILVNLPHAQPAYQWWTVDFGNQMISLSHPPRSFRRWRYIVKGDLDGTAVADQTKFRDWYWHFTEGGAAYTGGGFTCTVRTSGR